MSLIGKMFFYQQKYFYIVASEPFESFSGRVVLTLWDDGVHDVLEECIGDNFGEEIP